MNNRMAIASAISLLCVLGGCTSPDISDPVPLSTAAAPSTSRGGQLTEVTSQIPTSTTTTSITSESPTSSGEATTAPVSNSWPAEFTPEQAESAQKALAVVPMYLAALNTAQQAPGAKDWSPEIRKYGGEPIASDDLKRLAGMVTAGVHQVGSSTVDKLLVISLEGPTAIVQGCLDTTSRSLVFDADQSPAADPSSNPRTLISMYVSDYEGEIGWLLEESSQVQPVTPC